MEASKTENIFIVWFLWHFYEMPMFLLEVWKNYILFALNYFSVPALLMSFFSPWRKYRWTYPKIINVVEFFNTLISNLFSRILGAMMRTVLIILGIMLQIFVLVVGLIIFLLWILVPFIIVAGFLFVFVY